MENIIFWIIIIIVIISTIPIEKRISYKSPVDSWTPCNIVDVSVLVLSKKLKMDKLFIHKNLFSI